MYKPKPIDLTNINLPENLIELREALAKNVHEVWAEQRMNDGWTYGEVRNDDKKEHPCLVEYEKLDDSEKEYDRITAESTLKLVLKSGYKIIEDK